MMAEISSSQDHVLGVTDHSKIVKTPRNGIDAVVKQSLRTEDPKAKDQWHREVSMLKAAQEKVSFVASSVFMRR